MKKSYHNFYCKYVFSRGEKKGEKCSSFSTKGDYCSIHSGKNNSVKKTCKYVFTRGEKKDQTCSSNVAKGSYCTSHVGKDKVEKKDKPVVEKKKKEVEKKGEKAEIESLVFEECEENDDYILNSKTKLIMSRNKKVIGQYHLMSFLEPEFYFIDAVSFDKQELIDIHGLQYETRGMHIDPPSIPGKENIDYDDRVEYWNDFIQEKNQQAKELEEQGKYSNAFDLRQSYNSEYTYYTLKEKKKYFAKWSKKIFGLNKLEYRIVLNTIKCGFFNGNGTKCEIELNTNHMFCNYHLGLLTAQKNINRHILRNKEWYREVSERISKDINTK